MSALVVAAIVGVFFLPQRANAAQQTQATAKPECGGITLELNRMVIDQDLWRADVLIANSNAPVDVVVKFYVSQPGAKADAKHYPIYHIFARPTTGTMSIDDTTNVATWTVTLSKSTSNRALFDPDPPYHDGQFRTSRLAADYEVHASLTATINGVACASKAALFSPPGECENLTVSVQRAVGLTSYSLSGAGTIELDVTNHASLPANNVVLDLYYLDIFRADLLNYGINYKRDDFTTQGMGLSDVSLQYDDGLRYLRNRTTELALPTIESNSSLRQIRLHQATASGNLRTLTSNSLYGINVGIRVLDPNRPGATLCATRPAATYWMGTTNRYNDANTNYGVAVAVAETTTGNTTTPPNYAPAEDETVTFAVTVTNYLDATRHPVSQLCARVAFTEGLTPPVSSQESAINGTVDIVPARPSNPTSRQLRANRLEYYAAYGSYDTNGQGQSPRLDPRRLEVNASGQITENRRFRTLSRCSDRDGRFDGLIQYQGRTFQQAGIFHVGYTDRAVDQDSSNQRLSFTVDVPATARASGAKCILAEVSARPLAESRRAGEAEPASDNVAVACVEEPAGAEVPVLLQEGRADLMTLHKCADGTKFPCAGKSADDLTQYVDGAGDDANGNAAQNSGSLYRVFQTEKVVVHVPDLSPQRQQLKDLSDNTKTGVYWLTGNPVADYTYNDAWTTEEYGVIPGVSVNLGFFDRTASDKDFTMAMVDKTPGGWPGRVTVNTAAYGKARQSWSYWLDSEEQTSTTVASFHGYSSVYPNMMEFGDLGTYVVDLTMGATHTDSNNVDTTYTDKATYTFHVGPVMELSVADGGVNPQVSTSQTALTVRVANGYKAASPAGARVKVTLPAGATVRQATASQGSYDSGSNVWTLPAVTPYEVLSEDGATLTLLLNGASVGAKGKASIYLPECFDSSGNPVDALHPDANGNYADVLNREACLYTLDSSGNRTKDTSNNDKKTTNRWGSYGVCIKDEDASTQDAADETTCENTTGNTWHTGNVYDYRPANNVAEIEVRRGGLQTDQDNTQFRLTAQRDGSQAIKLSWPRWDDPDGTPVDEYLVYRARLAGRSFVWQTTVPAVEPWLSGDTESDTYGYKDRKLRENETPMYRVYAVSGQRYLAVTNTTNTTLSAPQLPGTVNSLTAMRSTADATDIVVSWTAPSGVTGVTGYDVEHQSQGPSDSAYGEWTRGSTEQAAKTYTLEDTGGGTSYKFRVRSVSVVNGEKTYGPWRTSSIVGPVADPDRVGNLTATRQFGDETKIDVSWTAPTSGTNSTTTYDVEYRENGGAWTTAPNRTDLKATSYTLSDLPNGGKVAGGSSYQFQVRAVTTVGGDTITGNWKPSNTVSRVTTPGQVGSLRADRNATDDTIINVTWKAPSNATGATTYKVEHQVDGSGTWSVAPGTTTIDHPDVRHQMTTATGVSRYVFRVQAITPSDGSNLEGSWRTSNTVPVVGAPNQVGTVTATRQSDETIIKVEWTAPSSGTTPSGYYVQRQENGGAWLPDPATDHKDDPDQNGKFTYTFNPANGGSRYVFRVSAYVALKDTNSPKIPGSWRSSNTVPGLPAGNIASVTATRNATDPTKINLDWAPGAARATGYDVQYRKDSGGWISAVTAANQPATSYTHENAGGVETYQFRVRGVSDAGNGNWTESDPVEPPPADYYGADVGVDWVTIKMTGGPWWYEFRKNGVWGGCTRVASGGVTITGLWPGVTHAANLYEKSGCASADRIAGGVQTFKTLSDIYDWSMCWPKQGTDENGNPVYTDCRNIDNPNDFNNHTHKRSLLDALGVNRSDCAGSREHHSHGWPSEGGGQHWHCPY